jgi:hypothetical protein
MADENNSFDPTGAEINRGREQGLGVGQKELDGQRDPNRFQTETNPEQRSFGDDPAGDASAERPAQAAYGDASTDGEPDRNAADIDDFEAQLGAGTPANVDIHKLGQDDNPEQAWGEADGAAGAYSANHTRRGVKTEAERGQGAKTREANKDAVSRRT